MSALASFRPAVTRAVCRTVLPATAAAAHITACNRAVYHTASAATASSSSASSPATISRPASRFLHTVPSTSTPNAAAASSSSTSAAYNKHPHIKSQTCRGDHISHNLDLSAAAIGQVIEVPYETTLSESERVLWMSTFQIHDRMYTSSPFAQLLHLPHHPLPFYMILFKAISMGHVDETREVLDIGFENATYIRPAYVGDTLKQVFTIKHLKNTSNKQNTIVTVGCELVNQKNQPIFSVDKTMLFPGVCQPHGKISPAPKQAPAPPRSHLLSHILYNCDNLPTTNNLALLHEGQLMLHSVSRPIGQAMNMSLSTLFRWTHPSIYNMKRYKDEEIVVPGGLVLAGSIAATSRGLFETLSESLESCFFLNKVSPVDLIGAVSYISSIKQIKEGIEEVKIITLGLKDLDVARELAGVKLPLELFTMSLHRKQVEALCADYAPILQGKIVVKSSRSIIRQSPFAQQRSIPLL